MGSSRGLEREWGARFNAGQVDEIRSTGTSGPPGVIPSSCFQPDELPTYPRCVKLLASSLNIKQSELGTGKEAGVTG